MSQESISSHMPPTSQIPSHSTSYHPARSPQPLAPPSIITNITSTESRPIPTFSIHRPQSLNSEPSETQYNSIPLSPSAREGSFTSSHESPPPAMSAETTPVVPPSAASRQLNPFPISPSIASSAAGSKRTASGTIKHIPGSSASVPTSPASPVSPRFARSQTSVETSPRTVSQLSSQLRTRLSYALIKVQNNWTNESLDQIEARVAQGQHPQSPNSRLRIKRESSAGDDGFDSFHRHQRTSSEPSAVNPLSMGVQSGNRTYESFWREHQDNPIRKTILQASRAASQALGSSTYPPTSLESGAHLTGGALQPPAQIVRDRDRRSRYNPARHPPTLHQSGSNQSIQSNYSNASTVPNTPPPAPSSSTAQRTMEQDAVESLMFLSSPGHSRSSRNRSNESHSQDRAPVPRVEPIQYNYGRNATTWPNRRRSGAQVRTGLSSIGMMDSGVGGMNDDDLTDEDVSASQESISNVKHVRRGGEVDIEGRNFGDQATSKPASVNISVTSDSGTPAGYAKVVPEASSSGLSR